MAEITPPPLGKGGINRDAERFLNCSTILFFLSLYPQLLDFEQRMALTYLCFSSSFENVENHRFNLFCNMTPINVKMTLSVRKVLFALSFLTDLICPVIPLRTEILRCCQIQSLLVIYIYINISGVQPVAQGPRVVLGGSLRGLFQIFKIRQKCQII